MKNTRAIALEQLLIKKYWRLKLILLAPNLQPGIKCYVTYKNCLVCRVAS